MEIYFCLFFLLVLFALIMVHLVFLALAESYFYPDPVSKDRGILK